MSRRIRTIKPEVLLHDERAAALSDGAFRLWIGIRLLADDWGTFRAGSKYLAAQIWNDTSRAKKVAGFLEELRAAGRVVFFEAEGSPFAVIVRWEAEQRVDNRSEATRLPKPPEEIQALTSKVAAVLPDSLGHSGKAAARARARASWPLEGDTDLGNGVEADPDRARTREDPSPSPIPKSDPTPPIVIPDAYAYAFARGFTAGTAHPCSRPTSRTDMDRLIAIVDAHCPDRGDGAKASVWLEGAAETFGREANQYQRRNGVRGLEEWLNTRGLANPGVQPVARGEPSWKPRNVVTIAAGAAGKQGTDG